MKVLAVMWKQLSPDLKMHYQKIAEDDKNRYFAEMKEYTGPMHVPNKRQKKPLGAPKRAMSAFLSFSQLMRPQVCAKHPELKNADVLGVIAQLWKQGTEKEKAPHIERERREREKYHEDTTRWKEESNFRKNEKLETESSFLTQENEYDTDFLNMFAVNEGSDIIGKQLMNNSSLFEEHKKASMYTPWNERPHQYPYSSFIDPDDTQQVSSSSSSSSVPIAGKKMTIEEFRASINSKFNPSYIHRQDAKTAMIPAREPSKYSLPDNDAKPPPKLPISSVSVAANMRSTPLQRAMAGDIKIPKQNPLPNNPALMSFMQEDVDNTRSTLGSKQQQFLHQQQFMYLQQFHNQHQLAQQMRDQDLYQYQLLQQQRIRPFFSKAEFYNQHNVIQAQAKLQGVPRDKQKSLASSSSSDNSLATSSSSLPPVDSILPHGQDHLEFLRMPQFTEEARQWVLDSLDAVEKAGMSGDPPYE